MLTKAQNWNIYHWGDGGEGHTFTDPEAFELVATIRRVWPVPEFTEIAKRLGFPYVERDGTLVGGYFTRPDGQCLVCVPEGMPPERVYL